MDIFLSIIKAIFYLFSGIFLLSVLLICIFGMFDGFNRKWKNKCKTKCTKKNSKKISKGVKL